MKHSYLSVRLLQPIHLQVNVGAPAARNWLLAEPEVRKAKWAVFLDDDVELEPNWLEELLATAQSYGNPGAVGCRITSTGAPRSLQSADYHLFPPGNGTSQIEGLTERIMVFDSCRNGLITDIFIYPSGNACIRLLPYAEYGAISSAEISTYVQPDHSMT